MSVYRTIGPLVSLPLAIFCGFAGRFLSDLDRNPGERLFHDVAYI